MKKPFWKRLSAMLLATFLLMAGFGSALASITGLDPVLSDWLEQESMVRFSLSMELNALLPFTSKKLAMMNDVLGHLSFLSAIEWDGSDSLTTLALACEGDSVFTLTERESGGSFALETTLLPNRVLESTGLSAIDSLMNEPSQAEPMPTFDMAAAISEAEACYPALISACEPYAEKKKANYKIKDIGTAKWSQIARLTPEQSDEMLPLLRAVLQCGMDEAFRAELNGVRFAKGFIVALYQLTENGDDLAVYMKGNLIFPDQTTASLSYQWAFITKNGERKDAYKYELARNTKPKSSRMVGASLAQSLADEQLKIKENTVLTTKTGNTTTAQTQKVDLSGKARADSRTLQGSISRQVKVTEAGKSQTTIATLTPALTLINDNGEAILSGVIQTENQKDKAITSALTLTFASDVPADFSAGTASQGLYAVTGSADGNGSYDTPLSSVFQIREEDATNAQDDTFLVNSAPLGMQTHAIPEAAVSVSLDTISETARAGLMDELSQSLAGKLLIAVMTLPEEDLSLLKDGMTDEDYASFLSLLSNL